MATTLQDARITLKIDVDAARRQTDDLKDETEKARKRQGQKSKSALRELRQKAGSAVSGAVSSVAGVAGVGVLGRLRGAAGPVAGVLAAAAIVDQLGPQIAGMLKDDRDFWKSVIKGDVETALSISIRNAIAEEITKGFRALRIGRGHIAAALEAAGQSKDIAIGQLLLGGRAPQDIAADVPKFFEMLRRVGFARRMGEMARDQIVGTKTGDAVGKLVGRYVRQAMSQGAQN